MTQWRDYLDKILKDADSVLNINAVGGIETKGESPYDVLLIGGEPISSRKEYVKHAAQYVNPGGWVMLGNANRPEYATERAALKEKAVTVKTFDCNQNGSLFVVIEFYQMPGKPRKKAGTSESRKQPERE